MIGAWLGVIGAASGAAITEGCRGVSRLVRGRQVSAQRDRREDLLDAQRLREELWAEVRDLRRRIDEVSVELERARLAYIELLGKYTELHAEHKALQHAHDELKQLLNQERSADGR